MQLALAAWTLTGSYRLGIPWVARAGGGVEARLGRRLWISFHGQYGHYADSNDRPDPSLDPGGWAFSGRFGVNL